MHARSLVVAVLWLSAAVVQAGPEAITYQGSLLDADGVSPVIDGTYGMTFRMYAVETSGTQSWHEEQDVSVTGGLFSVVLGEIQPLRGLFATQPELWLEVAVDMDDSGSFDEGEVFLPRPKLTGVPWAVPRIEHRWFSPSLISGYAGNFTRDDPMGATIGGGGDIDLTNRVSDHYGTVAGGAGNLAGDMNGEPTDAQGATVGGGVRNDAEGENATVSGGILNRATSDSATVCGGYGNRAYGQYATAAGGRSNYARGPYSFAAGRRAHADHSGSFVLADSTNADFASVRDDALRVRFNGGATFQVNDGYWFRVWHNTSPSPARVLEASNGAHLTAGGAWTNGSDRNAKENFATVDGREILARLAQVPVQTWNYKAEDRSVRHMGPTAQDLHAAFGLGNDDKTIATIDADGVALAAIQGLHAIVKEKEAEIFRLQAKIDLQQDAIAQFQQQSVAMQARLAALEALVARASRP